MDKSDEQYYTIGKLSKLCNIPIRTLHYYDDIGLLQPQKVDPYTNYRYYSHHQLTDISAIKHFKMAGFSLKEIKQLLERNNIDYNQEMIRSKCLEIENNIKNLMILKNRLKLYLETNYPQKEDNVNPFSIEVKEIPITSVAYSRYQGPSYPDEFRLRYTKLNNLIEKNKLHITGTMMAVYYDDYRNYDYMNADIEVCVTVAEQEGNSDIIRKFGGFLAAVTMHYGSYKTMNQTYAKALEWLDRNGFVYVGGAIENYIIDVITSIDENDFVTEIIIPIAEFHK